MDEILTFVRMTWIGRDPDFRQVDKGEKSE